MLSQRFRNVKHFSRRPPGSKTGGQPALTIVVKSLQKVSICVSVSSLCFAFGSLKTAVCSNSSIPRNLASLSSAFSPPAPPWQAYAANFLPLSFSAFSRMNDLNGGAKFDAQTGNPNMILSYTERSAPISSSSGYSAITALLPPQKNFANPLSG